MRQKLSKSLKNQGGATAVVIGATAIVALILAGVGVYFIAGRKSVKNAVENDINNVNSSGEELDSAQGIEAQKANETNNILTANKDSNIKDDEKSVTDLDGIGSNDKKIETIKIKKALVPSGQVEISLKAPIKWDVFANDPSRYSMGEMVKFSFRDDYGNGSEHTNESGFMIYNITNWMGTDDSNDGIGAMSATEKQKMVSYLFNYRKTKQVSNGCLFRQVAHFLENTAVYTETMDGLFSGCAVVGVSPQDPSYDPHLYIEMVGKVDNRYIYIDGAFKLHDDFVRELSNFGAEDFTKYLKRYKEVMSSIQDKGLGSYEKPSNHKNMI